MMVMLALMALALAATEVDEAGAGCINHTNNEIECCAGFEDEIWIFDVRTVACAYLDINWDELNITLTLELNDVILFESTFGFDTAPELCTDFMGTHICLGLTDMKFDEWNLSGCISLTLDYNKEIDLGCFDTSKLDE